MLASDRGDFRESGDVDRPGRVECQDHDVSQKKCFDSFKGRSKSGRLGIGRLEDTMSNVVRLGGDSVSGTDSYCAAESVKCRLHCVRCGGAPGMVAVHVSRSVDTSPKLQEDRKGAMSHCVKS